MDNGLLQKFKGIKSTLAEQTVPKTPQFKALGKEILKNPEADVAALLVGVDEGFELGKKKFKFEFSESYFVQKIVITLNESFSFRKIEIECYGGRSPIQHKIGSGFRNPSGAGEAFELNTYLLGINFSSSGRIGGKIQKIEIIGCKASEMRDHEKDVEKYSNTLGRNAVAVQSAIEEALTEVTSLNTEKTEFDALLNDLEEKEKRQSELKTEIEDAKLELRNAKDHLEKVRTDAKSDENRAEDLKDQLAETKSELIETRKSLKEEKATLSEVLKEKTFYNQNLSGHKAETDKEVFRNYVWIGIYGGVLFLISLVALWIFHDAIEGLIGLDKVSWPVVLGVQLRIALGGFYVFAVYKIAQPIRDHLRENIHLQNSKKDTEQILISTKRVANAACEEKNFTDEEKRDFEAVFQLLALQEMIPSLNVEAVKEGLGIEEDVSKLVSFAGKIRKNFQKVVGDETAALPVKKKPTAVAKSEATH